MASSGSSILSWIFEPLKKIEGSADYAITLFFAHNLLAFVGASVSVLGATHLARKALKKGDLGMEFTVLGSTKIPKGPIIGEQQLYDLELETTESPFRFETIFDSATQARMHKHFKRAAKLSGNDSLLLNYLEEAVRRERFLGFLPVPKFFQDDYGVIKKELFRAKFNFFAQKINVPKHDRLLDSDDKEIKETEFFIYAYEDGAEFKEFKVIHLSEDVLTMKDFPKRDVVRVQNRSLEHVLSTESDPQQHMDRYDLLVQLREEYQMDQEQFIERYGVLVPVHKNAKQNKPTLV